MDNGISQEAAQEPPSLTKASSSAVRLSQKEGSFAALGCLLPLALAVVQIQFSLCVHQAERRAVLAVCFAQEDGSRIQFHKYRSRRLLYSHFKNKGHFADHCA